MLKKEEIYKKLGARQFQQLVYKAEHIKFALLKNQLSFLVPLVEKGMKRNRDKLISRANSDLEADIIDKKYKMDLLLFRKEINLEQNRNYHFNLDYTKDFDEYLKWNKRIHVKGLIKDIFSLLIFSGVSVVFSESVLCFTIPLLVLNSISLIIDFECVNLQNYHLVRYEKVKEGINKRKKRELENKTNKYSNAISSINKQIDNSNEIPKLDLSKMSKEELYELKGLLLEVKNNNNRNNECINNNQVKERRLHL